MTKFLFIFNLALLSCFYSYGQQKESTDNKYTLSAAVEPLFGFINCIRADAIVGKAGSSSSFALTPELYIGKLRTESAMEPGVNYNDQISGGGIGIHHRLNISKNPGALYFSYGAIYRRINITYQDQDFIPYQRNGLQYYEYGTFTDEIKINSLLADVNLGMRILNTKDVFGEFYFGAGYKAADKKSSLDGYRHYDRSVISYAYQGFTFLAGFKLGLRVIK